MSAPIRTAVFVDATIDNIQHLLDGVRPGVHVTVLLPDQDGVTQITRQLQTLNSIETVHIVAHGAPGCLKLGHTQLSLDTLDQYAEALQSWFGSGAQNPKSLLLYGCNVAAGDAGEEFLDRLYRLTGAAIGASTSKVGNPAQGGSWQLDTQLGKVEADAAFVYAVLATYPGTLSVSISGLDSFSFTEGNGPTIIDSNITFSSTVTYNDGQLRFSLTNSTSNDQLSLTSAIDPNAVGAISVLGSDVYLGNGAGKDRIGSIDAVEDGTNGQDLVINLASPLVNSGFETGDLTGWTAYNQNFTNTVEDLNGNSIDYSFSNGTVTGTGTIDTDPGTSASYTVQLSNSNVSSGSFSLQLESNGNISGPKTNTNQPDGNGSLHGPYVISDPFQAFAGDSITLDWAAQGGSDAYEVFGFLVGAGTDGTFGTSDDTRTELFSQRGDTQSFTEASATIGTSGEYEFEFVCGSYDKTGGLLIGASLYIDNVRLVSSTSVTDSVIATIAEQVAYDNTSANPDTTPRTLDVTVVNGNGESSSASSTGVVTAVNNQPQIGTNAALTLDEGATAAITAAYLNGSDLDNSGTGLIYTLTSSLTNGTLWVDSDGSGTVNGAEVALTNGSSFTQADIDNGQLKYSHNGSETTTDSFGFTLADGGQDGTTPVSGTFNLTVTPVNDPPTGSATGTVADASEDTDLTINLATLTQGFTDPDGDSLLVTGISADSGSITDNGDGTFTYTPAANYSGPVNLTYTVSDGNGGTVPGVTRSFAVTPVNDPPTGGIAFTGTLAIGQELTADTSTLGTDPDGSIGTISYQWQVSANGTDGWGDINGATDSAFTLTGAEVGQYVRLTITYSDGSFSNTVVSDPSSSAISPNIAPVIGSAATANFAENATSPVIDVDATDANNDSLTYSLTGSGADDALFSIDSNSGVVSFINSPNFEFPSDTGADNVYNFQVGVFDGTVTTTQDIAVTVTDVNEHSDFNGDGNSDIVWRGPGTGFGQQFIWNLDGNGGLSGGTALPFTVEDPNWVIEGTGDMDGDGKEDDLIWHNSASGEVAIWQTEFNNNQTEYTGGSILANPLSTDFQLQGIGDFDGDKFQDDLVFFNANTNESQIWYMDNGTVTSTENIAATQSLDTTGWSIGAVSDADGDGLQDDLIWHNSETGDTSAWFMDGSNATGGAILFNVTTNWVLAGATDFDSDLSADDLLWWDTSSGATAIWFMDGTTYTGGILGLEPAQPVALYPVV